MMAKFIFTVAVTLPLLPFLTAILQVPVVVAVTEAYNLSWPTCRDTTTTSLAPICVLLKINLLESLAEYVFGTQVITPEGAFKVTPVVILVP